MEEECKYGDTPRGHGRRVFGVIARGYPLDLEAWVDSAKHHGIYVIFTKTSRTKKLKIEEENW